MGVQSARCRGRKGGDRKLSRSPLSPGDAHSAAGTRAPGSCVSHAGAGQRGGGRKRSGGFGAAAVRLAGERPEPAVGPTGTKAAPCTDRGGGAVREGEGQHWLENELRSPWPWGVRGGAPSSPRRH